MAYVSVENLKTTNVVIGAMLKIGRSYNEMSRAELGQHLGVSETVIKDYEVGVKAIPAHHLYAASQILGLRIEFFFKPLLYPEEFDNLIH